MQDLGDLRAKFGDSGSVRVPPAAQSRPRLYTGVSDRTVCVCVRVCMRPYLWGVCVGLLRCCASTATTGTYQPKDSVPNSANLHTRAEPQPDLERRFVGKLIATLTSWLDYSDSTCAFGYFT